jgi:hypothetical protein
MIPRIIFILVVVVFISCKKDENNNNNNGPETYDITITGVISDQVTGQPISGAIVSCGAQRFAMSGDGLVKVLETTLSGPDGMYKLITQTESANVADLPMSLEGNCIALIAAKQGFGGSIRSEIGYWNGQNSVTNIQLYHSAQLNLHIKNDTVNNSNDEEQIWLVGHGNTNFMTICKGRKFDTIYEINGLWGNSTYYTEGSNSGGFVLKKDIITLKPDTINYLDITF